MLNVKTNTKATEMIRFLKLVIYHLTLFLNFEFIILNY